MARLGGPDIPAQCTAITMVLNNFDGYYTTGAGSDLGPGSRMRVQWRATSSDAWVTRFQGRLSELVLQFNGFSFFTTRWVGPLYRFTSGNIPGRLIINQTPQSIMTVLADAAGVATGERDFDTSTDEWNRQLSPGYQGVQEVQSMVDGFIYDAPDYKVRLELPATRAAKTVVARYTDGAPTAAELGVPPPRRLTRPFGIINHVDGEYHYYTPESSTPGGIDTGQILFNSLINVWQTFTTTIELDSPPAPTASTTDYTFLFEGRFSQPVPTSFLYITYPDTSGSVTYTMGPLSWTLEIRNASVDVVGGTVCISFEHRGIAGLAPQSRGRITATISGLNAINQTIAKFGQSVTDANSRALYGYRPRPSPVVIGLYQATPLADDFTPDYADLNAAMQVELDHFAEPIPVFAIERGV